MFGARHSAAFTRIVDVGGDEGKACACGIAMKALTRTFGAGLRGSAPIRAQERIIVSQRAQ